MLKNVEKNEKKPFREVLLDFFLMLFHRNCRFVKCIDKLSLMNPIMYNVISSYIASLFFSAAIMSTLMFPLRFND